MLGAPRKQTDRPSGWPQVRSVWRWSMKIVTEAKNNINSMYVQVLGLHVDKLVWPCWGRLSWCWRRRKPAWSGWGWNPMGPRAAGEDKGGASHPTPDPRNPHQQIMSMSRCENSIWNIRTKSCSTRNKTHKDHWRRYCNKNKKKDQQSAYHWCTPTWLLLDAIASPSS